MFCPSGTLSEDLKGCALNSPASSIARAKPAVVRVRQQTGTSYCPIQAFDNYVRYRGKSPGYLFVWPSGNPVSRTQFISTLNLCLSSAGLSTTLYKSHSFRIGAATWAVSQGASDTQLREMDVGPPMLSNVTFASINTPNIYFLAPGGLFLAGQWHSGQGPACHWPVSGWGRQPSLLVCLVALRPSPSRAGTYVSVYTPRLASSRNVTMT